MTTLLTASLREEKGKKVKQLRKKDFLPVVLYGHGIDSIPLKISYNEFEKIYNKAGKSTIIDLSVGDKEKYNILIHDVDINPKTRKFIHADFYRVKMDEKITAEVPLEFIGESRAVEEEDGVLAKNLNAIEVECFPQYLPSEIEVDISSLDNFEDAIHVADLKLSENIKVLTGSEELVVTVNPPISEEELAELEEAPQEAEVAEVEAIKEKPEGEMEEEGAEAEDKPEGVKAETPKEEQKEPKK